MRSFLRTIAVFAIGFVLAVWTSTALGAIDERKLFVLWAIFALAIHGVLRLVRKRSTNRDST